MRETSLKCYYEIMKNGKLARLRKLVYEGVAKYGPCTAGELSLHLPMSNGLGHMSTNNVATTLTQLRDKLGIVYEVGTKDCNITGHECIEWELKEDAWPMIAKHVVPKQTARQRVVELEQEVKELKAKCLWLETENIKLKTPIQPKGSPQMSLFQ